MATIIPVRPKRKSLLRKETYGDFEKKVWNLSKMATDQHEKYTIGISVIKK